MCRILSRYKKPVADRLFVGALAMAYNITSIGRFQGPFPEAMTLGNNSRMRIQFDTAVRCQSYQSMAFEVCDDTAGE